MNALASDPHWHGYMIVYFYLGGIAAGLFAIARLINLFGIAADRPAARLADLIVFPLVIACGLVMVLDAGRPERLWHVIFDPETDRTSFPWWPRLPLGTWGLLCFGVCSALAFVGALADENRLGLGRLQTKLSVLRQGMRGELFATTALASAFFLATYTGTLLPVTNQPIWGDTTWIAPLFLTSAASTGIAAMVLLSKSRGRAISTSTTDRLGWTDSWTIFVEFVLLVGFAVSIGRYPPPALGLGPGRFWPALLIPGCVVPLSVIAPLVLKKVWPADGVTLAAVLSLLGGFALRAAIVGLSTTLLIRSH
jgi:protein NrfD